MSDIALASRHSKLDTARRECCVHNLTWQVLLFKDVAFASLLYWLYIGYIVTPNPGNLSLCKYPYGVINVLIFLPLSYYHYSTRP